MAIVLASFFSICDAHGRLTVPMPRKGGGYEDSPVKGHTGESFVCRHANRNPNVPIQQWTAGTQITIRWDFGANHVGDCALFLSYDVAASRKDQKYFKIANFPECNQDNKQPLKVNLPSWLPAGDVVLRWDWYALHVFPGNVEFYDQCVDAKITSSSKLAASAIPAYSIISPPVYPGPPFAGKYRSPFNPSAAFFMTGPKCVGGISGNCCDLSSYQKGSGYRKSACSTSGSSGEAPDGSKPTPLTPPSPSTPATPSTPALGNGAACDDGSAGSCKKQCQSKCINQSGGVKVNQCWGSPRRYVECTCSDNSKHAFSGCACEHGNCPSSSPPVAPSPGTPTTPTTPSAPNGRGKSFRCGSSWGDAESRCGTLCPQGTNEECPGSEGCFADLGVSVCAGMTPVKPPPPPPSTPVTPPSTPVTPPSNTGSDAVIRETVANLRAQATELNAMASKLEATLLVTGELLLASQLE